MPQDSGRRGARRGEVKKEPYRAGDTNGAECHVGLSPEVSFPEGILNAFSEN